MKTACALTLAGLDPGGGAGVLADVRAFARAGAFGAAVVVLTTVQSTRGLVSVQTLAPRAWLPAAREVLAAQRVRALKTGALGSVANVRAVLGLARQHPTLPLVVDPVMIATKGASPLLAARALGAMRELAARATVLTPNADEAAALLGRPVRTLEEARAAALALHALGPRAVLVKGGHLRGARATDVLATARGVVELSRPRVKGLRLHGGGCTLASLVAGRLAASHEGRTLGDDALVAAVRFAADALAQAIEDARDVGGPLSVLDPTAG